MKSNDLSFIVNGSSRKLLRPLFVYCTAKYNFSRVNTESGDNVRAKYDETKNAVNVEPLSKQNGMPPGALEIFSTTSFVLKMQPFFFVKISPESY